jgi:hypothetical protein
MLGRRINAEIETIWIERSRLVELLRQIVFRDAAVGGDAKKGGQQRSGGDDGRHPHLRDSVEEYFEKRPDGADAESDPDERHCMIGERANGPAGGSCHKEQDESDHSRSVDAGGSGAGEQTQ